MWLAGREGNQVGLTPIAYQFPANATDPWESNQLLVDVRVTSARGTWRVADPCLTTWEANALATWLLRATAVGTLAGPSTFDAPNVTMRAARSAPGWFVVTVDLELEQRPPWAPDVDGAPLRVELNLETPQLLDAARKLLAELADFPQRGPDPTL